MLIVAGFIDVAPDDRERFLASRRDAVAATRDEPGCIEYVFSADLADPGRVRVFECWESADDLALHLEVLSGRAPSPGGVDVVARRLLRYEVTGVQELGT